uniref:GABA transporter 1-like isoform X3 n=1 Tax=Rhizophora mucronata TaxID=61149 RepID=A0A2P2Q8D3_RHIMU
MKETHRRNRRSCQIQIKMKIQYLNLR